MKVKSVIFLLLFTSISIIKAQEYIFHRLGAIKTDDTVKGYYFLISEEKSKKVKEFILEIYDPNLVSIAKVTFTVHPDFNVSKSMPLTHPSMIQYLQNISYVDNFLMLQLYKMKEFEVIETRLYVVDILKNSICATFDNSIAGIGEYFLAGHGSIIRAKGTNMEAVDYTGKVLWTTSIESDGFKTVSFFHNGKNAISKFNNDLIKVSVYKTGGKEKGYFEEVRLYNVQTGNQVFKFDGAFKEAINYTPEYIQETTDGNYVVMGSYKTIEDKNTPVTGLFFQKLSESGDVIASKNYSYEDYIKKCMPIKKADRLSMDNVKFKGMLYNNGNISLILSNNGFSYFSMRLKEKASVFENDKASDVVLNGLCIFEVNQNLEVIRWNTLNNIMETTKYKSDEQKQTEYFFDQPVINKTDNNMVLNALVMKSKNFKDKTKFVSVKLSNSKIIGTQEIDVNQEATWVDFIDAKPGYVLIAEYYEKQKKLDKRLEKISYQ